MGWDMLRSFSGQLKARRIEIPSKRIQHMLKRNFESKDGMGKPDIFFSISPKCKPMAERTEFSVWVFHIT